MDYKEFCETFAKGYDHQIWSYIEKLESDAKMLAEQALSASHQTASYMEENYLLRKELEDTKLELKTEIWKLKSKIEELQPTILHRLAQVVIRKLEAL